MNKTARIMFLNHVPLSVDRKIPHWDEVSGFVCKGSCCKNVFAEQFTLPVNGIVFSTLDILRGSRCPM